MEGWSGNVRGESGNERVTPLRDGGVVVIVMECYLQLFHHFCALGLAKPVVEDASAKRLPLLLK
jgi:hypothetical protein